tara:strand:- start:163 stop:330 length:168 start_codon:yes stop_codon:yes gene_type:complete
MAWTRESKTNPIIDATLGALTTWNGTEFIWNNITASWKTIWTKEVKSSAGWTKEA